MSNIEARLRAEFFVRTFHSFFSEITIAGSVLRKEENPKDIEIVGVIKSIMEQSRLKRLLSERLLGDDQSYQFIKTGTDEIAPWVPADNAKYWRLIEVKKRNPVDLSPSEYGYKIDLFFAAPENFGWIFVMRTGPKEFGEFCIGRWKTLAGIGREEKGSSGGYLQLPIRTPVRTGQGRCFVPVPTPTEKSLFDLLAMPVIAPEDRKAFIENGAKF